VRFSSSDNAHYTLLVIHDMTKFMESESQLKNTEALGVQTVTHDDLTGLLNQYGFMDFMKHELEHAKRTGTPTGLILMDIDQFKQINERYGHGGGDFLLKEMSDYVRNHLREYDILARLSGDKFILLLPETAWEKCFVIAERLRLALETHDTIYLENTIRITVSLGVVGIPSHYEYSMDELFAILNSALNTAKSTRNTVFYLPRSFHNNIL
jgi:diguanylate cyclase (GGDEF)-like protein